MSTKPSNAGLWTGTEGIDTLITAELALDDQLKQHLAKSFVDVHGNWTVEDRDFFDAAAHRVGRKVISVKVGTVTYKIPGDQSISGPPQTPKLAAITAAVADGISVVSGNTASSARPSGYGEAVSVSFSCVVTGTLPIICRWQFKQVSTWVDLPVNASGSGSVTAENGNGLNISYTGANSGTTPSKLTITHAHNSNDNIGYETISLRLRASNVAIGGYEVFSGQTSYSASDAT